MEKIPQTENQQEFIPDGCREDRCTERKLRPGERAVFTRAVKPRTEPTLPRRKKDGIRRCQQLQTD